MRRIRSTLTALFAAIGALIIVAATGNQALNGTLRDHAEGHSFSSHVYDTLLSFSWRFTPGGAGRALWSAQLVGIGVFVVLTFIFVWAVTVGIARPAIGILVGVWASVVLAAALAGIARNFAYSSALFPAGSDDPYGGRASYAIFNGANSLLAVFAIASGLLIAIFATIVAKATSREVEVPDTERRVAAMPGGYPAEDSERAGPPVWSGDSEPGPWRGEPSRESAEDRGPTPTQSFDAPGAAGWSGSSTAEPRTEVFEPRRTGFDQPPPEAVRDEPPRDPRPADEQARDTRVADETQRFDRPTQWPDDPRSGSST
ncbi:MAG: hypothetical protein ABJB98_05820 [Actinomycetota bacterium]